MHYSIGRLSVRRLFTSCIRQCLVSRACDWVMSALSAVLLIISFPFRSAFLPCRLARRHKDVLDLYQYWTSDVTEIWVGFIYEAYSPEEWLWIDSNGKMKTGHPVEGSYGSEFPAICNHCVVMAEKSHKTSKFLPFLEKRRLAVKFQNSVQNVYRYTDWRVVFKVR